MSGKHDKYQRRRIRRYRIRKRVRGDGERPRLAVFRSSKHIYAQIIDDIRGATLAAASSREAAALPAPAAAAGPPAPAGGGAPSASRGAGEKPAPQGRRLSLSATVGKLIAERARQKGISKVAFDRGGYHYHGRVKALADGARAGGLEF